MIKISFAAFAALLLAGGFSTAVYAQAPPPGQPYIQVPIPGMPGFGQQPRNNADTMAETIGNAGNIASALRTENTKCAIGWQPPMAKIENGSNIAFAKSTKSESTVGAVKEETRVIGVTG
jgi:hypothetical protein